MVVLGDYHQLVLGTYRSLTLNGTQMKVGNDPVSLEKKLIQCSGVFYFNHEVALDYIRAYINLQPIFLNEATAREPVNLDKPDTDNVCFQISHIDTILDIKCSSTTERYVCS